jgi:hypothetical protein
MVAATLLLLASAQQTRADVTFENLSQFPVYVFLKGQRKTIGPINPRASLLVDGAFVQGENQFLVVRGSETSTVETDKVFAAMAPRKHVLKPSDPGHVNIDVTDAIFKTVRQQTLAHPLRIENNTDYFVSVIAHGQAMPIGHVAFNDSQTFSKALPNGKTELLVIAQRPPQTVPGGKDVIVDIAVTSVEVVSGQTSVETLVVTDKMFGERGLPPVGTAPPVEVARPSIEGKWRTPDGLTVRFEGSNGYWIEVGFLKDYGFKSGDHGFRGLKEDPSKPGTFNGEVLYRFLGGREDGWKSFTVTVKDKDTLNNAAGDWKRIE